MIDRPYGRSLRGKITNRALLLGILPVILLGGVGYYGLTDLLGKTEQSLTDSKNTLADEVVGTNLSSSAAGVALRLDEFMLEIMYELPEAQSQGMTYVLDAESIERGLTLEQMPQHKAKESA